MNFGRFAQMQFMPPQPIDSKVDVSVILLCASKHARVGADYYARRGKRLFDSIISAFGLIALAPFLLLIGCCIKFASRGPVLFRQLRVGTDGRLFQILKFRSMLVDSAKRDLAITVSGDERITAIGRLLRKYKIDELPQLWNVLRGDMSLVGPRPELRVYVDRYTPEQREVLSVRPGITDPASLYYRDEERLLQESPDPEHLYCETILPHKLSLNLQYIANVSMANDILIISSTIKSLFLPLRKGSIERPPERL